MVAFSLVAPLIATVIALAAPAAVLAADSEVGPRLAKASPGKPAAGKPAAQPAGRRTGPADVSLVRSREAGCEPQCPEWIAVQGSIDAASVLKMKRVLSRLGSRRVPVLIDSPGGSVDEALAIGRLIRAKGLDIAVARTDIASCGRRDTACRKERAEGIVRGAATTEPAVCASACAFLLAGGVGRYAGARAQVGLHDIATFEVWYKVERTYTEPQELFGIPLAERKLIGERRVATHAVRKATSRQSYEKLSRYYAEMGVGSDRLVAIVKSTPHDRIHWLSRAELKATRLVTTDVEAIEVLRGRPATPGGTSAIDQARPPEAASVPRGNAGPSVVR